jgi:predicted phosphodiesterase
MPATIPLIVADGPVLVFGGPYSNLQATEAVLAEGKRRGIPTDRIICTGDLAAYCGEPDATITLVRDSGIHVVMGNCDEQLGAGGSDCGCGFDPESACAKASSAWYAYADRHVAAAHRPWLASLPRRIDLAIAGVRLALIHGGAEVINKFIFATTPADEKRAEIDLLRADGVIAGHSGLPFSEIIDGRLWHNAGVVGMPANDGTPRGWYSVLTPKGDALEIAHCALHYSVAAAQRAFVGASLPQEYARALATGLWPNCEILPAAEARLSGTPLKPGTAPWKPHANGDNRMLWPELLRPQLAALAQSSVTR